MSRAVDRAVLRGTRAAIAWAAALGMSGASACDCPLRERAGFIHSAAARLPANAKGALFLAPAGTWQWVRNLDEGGDHALYRGAPAELGPAAFRILADGKDELTAVVHDLPLPFYPPAPRHGARLYQFTDSKTAARDHERLRLADVASLLRLGVLREVTAQVYPQPRLLRISPAGGFQAGRRYHIAYLGPVAFWRYSSEVDHTIDTAPLVLPQRQFGLKRLGPARVGARTTAVCGGYTQPVVQELAYTWPASVEPYHAALVYFAQYRSQEKAYILNDFSSGCGGPEFARPAGVEGKELFAMECGHGRKITVRAWVGMLEVEDQLHGTALVDVDLRAPSAACATSSP